MGLDSADSVHFWRTSPLRLLRYVRGKTQAWKRPHVNLRGCPRLRRRQLICATPFACSDSAYGWAEHFSPCGVPQGKKSYLQWKPLASGSLRFLAALISLTPKRALKASFRFNFKIQYLKFVFVTYTVIQNITSSVSQVRSMDSAIIWNTNTREYT